MKLQTRPLFSGPRGFEERKPVKVLIYIDFEDTDGLTVTINVDGTRLSASKTYSQTRQSGLSNTGADIYRDVVSIFCRENIRFGKYFDLVIEKVVPSTGNVEIFAQEIELSDLLEHEDEFQDYFDDATGATTFVVEADASPEVEA